MVKKSGYIFEPSLFKTDINAQFPLTFILYLCNYTATLRNLRLLQVSRVLYSKYKDFSVLYFSKWYVYNAAMWISILNGSWISLNLKPHTHPRNSPKPFVWKWVLFAWLEIKIHFISMALHFSLALKQRLWATRKCPITHAKFQYGQQASKQHLYRKQFSTVFNKVAFKRVLTLKSIGRSHGMGVT